MGGKITPKVYLTFDVEGLPPKEDFVTDVSLMCLRSVLDLLEEFNFKATFFVPASVAEQLGKHTAIIETMKRHQIGYHSTVHSVRPMILEYTDVPDYAAALDLSTKRETSRVDLETGDIVDSGGILTLKRVFPKNDIVCFRAPFLAWSPPHLDALKQLGVRFDFSSYISDQPVSFKGITFYPGPTFVDGFLATIINRMDRKSLPKPIESLLLRKAVSILLMHPASLAIGSVYSVAEKKEHAARTKMNLAFSLLRFLFRRISVLQESNLIEVATSLNDNCKHLEPQSIDINRLYWLSIKNPLNLFNYRPQHTFKHFVRFFE